MEKSWAERSGNPANTPEGAELNAHYQRTVKDLSNLADAVRPFTSQWPEHAGSVENQGEHNDFVWFCHHYAHAIGDVQYASQLGRDGKLYQPCVESAISRIRKNGKEFDVLRARITAERDMGHMDAAGSEQIEACIAQLEERTEVMLGFLETYLEEHKSAINSK